MTNRGKRPSADGAVADKKSDNQRVADLEKRLSEAEQSLRNSSSKLRMALEVGKLGSWERDLATDEMIAGATCRATLGLPPGEPLTYARLQQILHPGDVERINQAMAFALATKTDFNVEHRVIRPDGRIGRVLVRGAAIYENDKPVRLVGVTQDVTEREKAREEMNLAQRRQEFLLTLNDQLRSLDDPNAIMEATARSLGHFLKVDCAGYGEVDETRGVILVEREWSKGAISNEGRAYRLYEFLPTMLAELKQGQPIFVEDVKSDPRTRDPKVQEAYSTLNARTALTVPLLKNQKLTALLYLHSAEPRVWTNDEMSLVEDVAERTWTAVEKARAEIGLRETEARFRIIAESLPALVWILTPDFELTYTNERWVRYSGLPAQEALGHSWMSAIHPEDIARIMEDSKEVRRNESTYTTEARYRSADGEYRWHMIQAAPLHDTLGEFKGWVGTSVDIHDLKETEKALRISEERLSLAQSAAGIGVFDWDIPSGKVTWTPEQERLFGLDPGTFRGDTLGWEEKVHPDDLARTYKLINDAFARHDRELNLSYRMRRPDGTIRVIDTIALLFYDADGNPLRLVGTNLDITRFKQAEERQHLLIRELHHRVKNTLATVQAIVGSTARTASSIDEFYQGFVGRIVSLARTHNLLTEDLWQKAALEDLIRTELGPYEDESRNRITIEGPFVELPSEAAVPVGMAIHELTTNAAKHGALSAFGGQVDVKWEIKPGGDRPILSFSWTEQGGPRVSAPSQQGFGSRLLQRVLTTQLQADVAMDFRADGLLFKMTMPIPGEPPPFNPDQ
ncbi:PAS domain-containing protein [Microvirga alba]|uniref:Blue-light-activated histidine kinase n=1 Tax=Microvirga alba TaxID=2791025 RepID=A0A931BQS8_9HYPH|nr:PAS domain-containing protein [Microvirga alba]MBF9232030.1 PAS domain-containing protein [Microvirga alba]